MNLDFKYQNPTTIYFGKGSLANLKSELANYGETIMLAYGKNSIKTIGLYDEIIEILKEAGKKVVELSGIMANPTYDKVLEGVITSYSIHYTKLYEATEMISSILSLI